MPPLTSLQLRRLFLRSVTSSSSSLGYVRHFSSSSSSGDDSVAQSLSRELLKDPKTEPLSVADRLKLNFSHLSLTPSLILSTLNLSPDAGRTVLGFNDWLISNPSFSHSDDTISFLVDYLGRRHDFKAIHDVMVANRDVVGAKTLASAVDRLVRAGRGTQTVAFFERMERDYGFKRNKETLTVVVEKLCDHGFASLAEEMVKSLAAVIFPDERICDALVRGWCVDKKLDEARRLTGEIRRGGFDLSAAAFNAMLECACKLCREKDPFRLQSEAETVLLDMESAGVPRNAETFKVLIDNLCKLRRTSAAVELFRRMGEWGCEADADTYLILTRSLYQSARLGEGDEMIDMMRSNGFGACLDKKAYFRFLTILCGIERVDHAMSVMEMMKRDGCGPGKKSYELLIGKLWGRGNGERAKTLLKEAVERGLEMDQGKEYPMDPKYAKIKREAKMARESKKNRKKKRETLPEKMARKRTTLKKFRLSFVKKPKKGMRQAY